ncbi:MAG: FtsX-like permease family protein, partial [Spirochaetales bacterium]|nr:FtsX-like permease family protein [Spirochaetales bacterium]
SSRELNVRMGDQLILQVNTITGQRNTGTFTVRGIIKDNTIFGSDKCFVDRSFLNNLLGMEPDQYSSLGLYFPNIQNLKEKSDLLYSTLKNRLPLSSPIHNKNELSFQLGQSWEGVRYFTIPLQVYVSQVADLLTAMELLSYFLYIVIILIVMLSVSVTYSLILNERTIEIGTMQALGLSVGNIRIVLIFEALLLFLLAVSAGFITALGVLKGISLFSFSWIPGFEIFMNNGKLTASFSVRIILWNIVILILAAIPAVFIPSLLISKIKLSDSLSGGKG